jgi:PAS domain S-box-containing protein
MPSERILVVEDESVVAMDIQDGLERLGYRVVGVAATGDEAIRLAETQDPDLVVMDIRLKGPLDGIATAQRIHLRAPTPVIFLTANVDESTLGRAMAADPYGYLSKPFSETDLHRAIEIALHKHRAEERHQREAADALRASEEPFRVVVDAVKDFAILLLNVDGIFVSWNAGAERIAGYSADEMVGRHYSVFYPGAAADILDRAQREGEAGEDTWLVRKDGSRYWATVLMSARTNGVSMIVRDISERRALQEQLRVRALQQAGVARLGQSALAARPINELADEAVGLVVECLGVERAAVLELLRDQAVFALRAGRGWPEPAERFVMPATREWQEGYSLESRGPVIVSDYRNEHRFSRSPLVRTHSMQSAATVAIRAEREPYGVLGAYHSAARAFSDDDVHFLQSLANVLAAAIRDQQAQSALRESEARFRAQYQRLPLATYSYQHVGGDEFVLVDYNEAAEALSDNVPDLIGRKASTIFAQRPLMIDIMRRAFREQRYLRSSMYDYKMLSGTLKDLELTFSFVPPDFVLLYVDDVTQLRSLSSRLINIQEEERKRIAREVHDELGQGLTALKLNVAALAQSLPPDAAETHGRDFERINDLIDENIHEVRRIASELRPTAIDDFGLTAAVQLAADNFEVQSGIDCEVSIRPDEIVAPPSTAIVIYRILQEALTNVIRHAQATRVEVRLRQDEHSIVLEVRDNGVGVTAEQLGRADALGLIGMRERASIIGADLRLEGVPERGTIVSLRTPVEMESPS